MDIPLKRPPPRDRPAPPSHDTVYRALRGAILHGVLPPGHSLTLRGIAAQHGVSMTPAREAVRRLAAEGALTLSATGRIATPAPGRERIEELAALRAMLEPELASRALPRAHAALIERMAAINAQIDASLAGGKAVDYVRLNLEFHRTLYLRAQAPAMLALAETVWLQLGPSMPALYGAERRATVTASHDKILGALRAGDEPGLRVSLRADVTGGLRLLLR